jgi:hypothetical protein
MDDAAKRLESSFLFELHEEEATNPIARFISDAFIMSSTASRKFDPKMCRFGRSGRQSLMR